MEKFFYIFNEYPWIVSIIAIISGIIGVFIGNWLAIGRDKRREFNAIVEPIRLTLSKESKKPSPYTKGIDDIDIFKLREVLPFWKKFSFNRAIKKYKKNKDANNQITKPPGEVHFVNEESVIHSINSLLEIIRKR